MVWWDEYHWEYNRAMNANECGARWIPLSAVDDWHSMLDMGGEL